MPRSLAGFRFARTSTRRPSISSTGTNLTRPETICSTMHTTHASGVKPTRLHVYPCSADRPCVSALQPHVLCWHARLSWLLLPYVNLLDVEAVCVWVLLHAQYLPHSDVQHIHCG